MVNNAFESLDKTVEATPNKEMEKDTKTRLNEKVNESKRRLEESKYQEGKIITGYLSIDKIVNDSNKEIRRILYPKKELGLLQVAFYDFLKKINVDLYNKDSVKALDKLRLNSMDLKKVTDSINQELNGTSKNEGLKVKLSEHAKLLTSYANTYVSSKESLDEFNKQINDLKYDLKEFTSEDKIKQMNYVNNKIIDLKLEKEGIESDIEECVAKMEFYRSLVNTKQQKVNRYKSAHSKCNRIYHKLNAKLDILTIYINDNKNNEVNLTTVVNKLNKAINNIDTLIDIQDTAERRDYESGKLIDDQLSRIKNKDEGRSKYSTHIDKSINEEQEYSNKLADEIAKEFATISYN